MLTELISIQRQVSDRAATTIALHSDWPCRAGCDHCCRSLAAIPKFTEPEWRLLAIAMEGMPSQLRSEITGRILSLEHSTRPFTCPMLDTRSGRCLTYEQRPIACRTYGFYVERAIGLYCEDIQSRADAGDYGDVVWGNQATIDDRSVALGPKRSMVEWLKRG